MSESSEDICDIMAGGVLLLFSKFVGSPPDFGAFWEGSRKPGDGGTSKLSALSIDDRLPEETNRSSSDWVSRTAGP